jgi:alginate O-acetyltransferase complex protein AlgI
MRSGRRRCARESSLLLFNSYVFWLFFLLVVLAYWRLPHRGQNRLLLVASYVFYGWWDWRFLSLIAISTLVDFVAARGIADGGRRRRRLFLLLSICTNLGLLGACKYYGFFAAELARLLAVMGLGASLPALQVVLPVGISFYTFQTMGYTIDVYRGRARPAKNLLDFALFVCFFPQLVAGPIERYERLMPQILAPRTASSSRFSEGLYHVLVGLFKKVVIADNMAPLANAVFGSAPASLDGGTVLVGLYAFAFQIYSDFSGYSSLARGLARWLGFDLSQNFRMPYFAVDPRDLWRRWHITLSSWLRDYLYLPLGGNRHGRPRTLRNLVLTMLLGGLWHGAGWTFLAWGLYHGLLLVLQRILPRIRTALPAWRRLGAILLMFHLTCLSWLLFRAETVGQAWGLLRRIATDPAASPVAIYTLSLMAFFLVPLLLLEAWQERQGDELALLARAWPLRAAVYSYFLLMLWYFPPEARYEFIYFQF